MIRTACLLMALEMPLLLHRQRVAELTRDVLSDYLSMPHVPVEDGSPFWTLQERAFAELRVIVLSSDIAVEVRAESRRCAFNADEAFIDSDWGISRS